MPAAECRTNGWAGCKAWARAEASSLLYTLVMWCRSVEAELWNPPAALRHDTAGVRGG